MLYSKYFTMNFFKKKEPQQPVQLATHTGNGIEELSELLERTLAVEEENNRILKRMQIMGRFSFWAKVVIWALILGVPVFFFQPIVDFIKSSAGENKALLGIPSSEQVQQAFDNYTTN
tara:strand:- start:268722 stop:269075 length:354 start_codon:yes stop_codon:yes gene_type:complete